jgi:hypothetical protein
MMLRPRPSRNEMPAMSCCAFTKPTAAREKRPSQRSPPEPKPVRHELIFSSLPVKKAFQTNILEDDGDEIDVVVSQRVGAKTANIDITLRPFEVATLRLEI